LPRRRQWRRAVLLTASAGGGRGSVGASGRGLVALLVPTMLTQHHRFRRGRQVVEFDHR
jgi:hypothetical protein